MSNSISNLILIFDDREKTIGNLSHIVGHRNFGDIIYKKNSLFNNLFKNLPGWAIKSSLRIKNNDDIYKLKLILKNANSDKSIFIISARAGFNSKKDFIKLIERLPYAEEDFVDRNTNPLLTYFCHSNKLIDLWNKFEESPIHQWDHSWEEYQLLKSLRVLDLGNLDDFLLMISGCTESRHFNEVKFENNYVTKSSSQKEKIKAEYNFFNLVPERMRPWLVPTFDFEDNSNLASYKMLRYFKADAALQWINGAFTENSFEIFINKVLFFINERPTKSCKILDQKNMIQEIFVEKVKNRINIFLEYNEGKRINQLAKTSNRQLEINFLIDRYLNLFNRYKNKFSTDIKVIGHGDLCLSNILYDPQHYSVILIDPKGALTQDQLWTHPIYDIAKLSHSILGDYDFINNGLYETTFSEINELNLNLFQNDLSKLKLIFKNCLESIGFDLRIIRLAEVSLFLSMLPLHIDIPNKVIALMLKSSQILDEIEDE